MKNALLVFLSLFISLIFLITPQGQYIDPFPFYDFRLYTEYYFYYLWEHVVILVLLHIISSEAREYRLFFTAVFWFQVLDLIDYCLTYNTAWGHIGRVPVTSNTLGAIILAGILIYEYYKAED